MEAFDFTSDLDADANWDEVTTAATAKIIVNGDDAKPAADTYEYHCGVYASGCDGVNQWVLIQLKDKEYDAGQVGAMLRQANADGSGMGYAVGCQD